MIHVIPAGLTRLTREYLSAAPEPRGAPCVQIHGFPDRLHLNYRLAPLIAKQNRIIEAAPNIEES